jgi:META domain
MLRRAVRRLRATALTLLCAVALTSCAPFFPSEADGPFTGDWRLVEAGWGDARFTIEGAGITLLSDGNSVRGFAGCNDYAFRLAGEPDALRFGDALDPGPPSPSAGLEVCRGWLERIESRYLTALLASDRADVQSETLRLSGGNSHLVFTAIPPFPTQQLIGTEWVLEGYGDTWRDTWTVDVVGSPTLRFLGPDRFLGTLGCGSIVGTYRVVRTEVFVVSLQRFGTEGCLSAFSEQDQLLAQFLDGFRAYLTGDHLILTHDRLQVVYSAVPPGDDCDPATRGCPQRFGLPVRLNE